MPELFHIATSAISGRGAFADVDIPKGARVAEYLGRRITKAESAQKCEANNPYIFSVTDEFDLDGDVEWNPARYINHSCDPNCEAENTNGQIFINAIRDIKAGDEITFNYGYDLENYKEYPCQCGAKNCVGYIVAEEFFASLRRKLAAKETGR